MSFDMLNNNYSTTKLGYKLLDDKYLDKNEQIKEDYKFKLNFPEFGIINSKIPAKENGKFDTLLFLPEGKGRKGEGGLRAKGYFKFSYEKKDNEWWIVQDGKFIKQIELDEDLVKNYEKLPLVSIVTVVYNGEKYLEETIQSVINQTYPNIEYIIIDGGSTDGTLDIIKKYDDRIDYWVSEKDKNMYDAINKGFRQATGKIYAYLNADDLYFDENVINDIVKVFLESQVDLVFGNIEFIDENSQHLYYYKGMELSRNLIKYLRRVPFAQQTAFWRKEVYKEIDGFDDNLKYVADSKFFFSIFFNNKYKFKKLDRYMAKFRWHDNGFSTKVQENMRLESEQMKDNLGCFEKNFFFKICIESVVKLYNIKNIIKKKK